MGNYIRNKALAGCARLAAKLYKFSGLFGYHFGPVGVTVQPT